jgi:hypothetical protein
MPYIIDKNNKLTEVKPECNPAEIRNYLRKFIYKPGRVVENDAIETINDAIIIPGEGD